MGVRDSPLTTTGFFSGDRTTISRNVSEAGCRPDASRELTSRFSPM